MHKKEYDIHVDIKQPYEIEISPDANIVEHSDIMDPIIEDNETICFSNVIESMLQKKLNKAYDQAYYYKMKKD